MAVGDSYIEPSALADYLKMSVPSNDEQLEVAVRGASEWVEGYCRRQFNIDEETSIRYFDVRRDGIVQVDDIGHASFTVATDSSANGTYSTTWATSDFQTRPLNAIAKGRAITELRAVGNYTFPCATNRDAMVKVTARWGWPAVPDAVVQATYIQAARIYKRRESAEGVLGGGDFGVVRVGTLTDPDVVNLLADFVLPPLL